MEIINELLSDNIDYLNALRNAEALPKNDSTSLKFSAVLKFALLAGVLSLFMYILFLRQEKMKRRRID